MFSHTGDLGGDSKAGVAAWGQGTGLRLVTSVGPYDGYHDGYRQRTTVTHRQMTIRVTSRLTTLASGLRSIPADSPLGST